MIDVDTRPAPGPYPLEVTNGDRIARRRTVNGGLDLTRPAARGRAGHLDAIEHGNRRALRTGRRQRVTLSRKPDGITRGRWIVQEVR